MSFDPHPDAKTITGLVCMVNWDDAKRQWVGVVCEGLRNPDGNEGIVIYDANTAETKVEIEEWGRESIDSKPWNKH